MAIEYDSAKARLNWVKHGVSFAAAEYVLDDEKAKYSYQFVSPDRDPKTGHSLRCTKACPAKDFNPAEFDQPPYPACDGCEIRFLTTGKDSEGELRTVLWTWRGENERIISVRTANSDERTLYHGT